MPLHSKKALDFPTGMIGKPSAHWMQLHNGNKEIHPGTVNDWEKLDDVETIQRDKAKVDVTILEDTLRQEDVAWELIANHPATPKKHAPSTRKKAASNPAIPKYAPSARNKAVKDVQDPQLALMVSLPLSSQVLQPKISASLENEEIQELNQQNISHEEDPSMGACQVLAGSDGSYEESDECVLHGESGNHIDAELKEAIKLG
ncbi:hypothetical protein ARMGADRAFT_1090125 [Armillaria gallica]|uniref:Uncharacterized protein n=1 Tax=Armillaria gallica TaxID=47427 RepID=A0A2H3CI04_ARMGA|nr:hypothetical protein ARMGADRAFT_1090125 [Armillaria gallica]